MCRNIGRVTGCRTEFVEYRRIQEFVWPSGIIQPDAVPRFDRYAASPKEISAMEEFEKRVNGRAIAEQAKPTEGYL